MLMVLRLAGMVHSLLCMKRMAAGTVRGSTMKITEGSIEGTTREGAEFTTTIIKEIVFKRGCNGRHAFVPVSGTVDVVTGGVSSTIDYGDGSCDKDFTITTAGVTTEHSSFLKSITH